MTGRQSSRDRLVEAAFALFAERGYEQATVDDIAERAGVGRTTFFRLFGSKEEVIFPDHDALLHAIGDRLAAVGPRGGLGAVAESVRLVLRHYLDEGDLARTRYQLTRTVPALRDREIAGTRQYNRVFYRFLHDWLGGGPDTGLRAELMAGSVVTAHNHVLRRWLRGQTDRPEAEFDESMAWMLDLFAQYDQHAKSSGDGGDEGAAGETAVVVFRTGAGLDTVLPKLRALLNEQG